MKGALEVERLSLRELCEGNLEWGLLYWGPWRRHLSARKLYEGNLDGGLLYWGLRRIC